MQLHSPAAVQGKLHLTMNLIAPAAVQEKSHLTMKLLVPAAVQGMHHSMLNLHVQERAPYFPVTVQGMHHATLQQDKGLRRRRWKARLEPKRLQHDKENGGNDVGLLAKK